MLKKSLKSWLDDYGASHQHPVNKAIHWVCVPVILWTLLALIWPIQLGVSPWINLCTAFMLFCLWFYARLSWPITIGMAAIALISVALIQWHLHQVSWPLWQTALTLFVLAWIGQFIGHKIEGKRPSFFEDLQFLLIGPAWLLSFVYRRLGIRY
ncbi:MAG: DUF962 domain-containing protein [Gammaproteobacteria bacterium]